MTLRCIRSLGIAAIALPALVFAQGGGGGGGAGGGGRGGAPGGPPQQQQPPKNLQVLPKTMTRPEVVAKMRTFTAALGVQCAFCHVAVKGEDGREQVQDYSLDDKDTKKTARGMLKMVADINGKYMVAMGRNLDEVTQVSCETCHHGISKPRTIQAEMIETVNSKGVDSAVAEYRDLHTRYFGRQSYDFGEGALVQAAQQLVAMSPDKRPAAITLLQLDLEFWPQSPVAYLALAQTQVQGADTAGAVATLTKALTIVPTNPQLTRLLTQLKPPVKTP